MPMNATCAGSSCSAGTPWTSNDVDHAAGGIYPQREGSFLRSRGGKPGLMHPDRAMVTLTTASSPARSITVSVTRKTTS